MHQDKIKALLKQYMPPAGQVIGLIGAGHFGEEIAEAAGSLGFSVLRCDPVLAEQQSEEEFEDLMTLWGNGMGGCTTVRANEPHVLLPLESLLKRADILTIQVPLTDSGCHPTRGMIDGVFMNRLRPGICLLNFSPQEIIASEVCRNPGIISVIL